MSILSMTTTELSAEIGKKNISPVEATQAVLDQIQAQNDTYHSYITVDYEGALLRAKEVEEKIAKGEYTGKLAGVPCGIKDNICTKSLKTTCASKILGDFVPTYSATAVELLEQSGAIILGKTNMDEFAMGSTSETSAFGTTLNPWNKNHVPGGSSGGSAAAVALNQGFFTLGSDTGGSIRQPASYCGVVGMKPTYGTVSRHGLIAYGSSFDQIGPLTKNVTDCATVLDCIMSYDPKDSTSVKTEGENLSSALVDDVKGMKIGIPTNYFTTALNSEVKDAIFKAVEVLKEKGAEVHEFELDLMEYVIPIYYTIASAEASSNLERFDGIKYGYRCKDGESLGLDQAYKRTRTEGFGSEVKRRIMLGSFVLSSGHYDAYYIKALKARGLLKQAFDQAFSQYDVIITPVAPTTAPALNSSLSDPLEMYLSDIYTVSANLIGIPGISLPCGMDSKGMPIGVQMLGNCHQERKIIQTAYSYESARGEFKLDQSKMN